MSENSNNIQFIQWIQEHDIKAVGFDFDATALQCKTNPNTSYITAMDFRARLVDNISPDFIHVTQELYRLGIPVGILTFNDDMLTIINRQNQLLVGGSALIRPILADLFSPEINTHIEIWAFNPAYHKMTAPDGTAVQQNKNWHLQCFRSRYRIAETSQVMLIDDDIKKHCGC